MADMKLINDAVAKLATHLKPVVEEIEKSPAICKDRYDQYMTVLSNLSGGSMNKKALISLALVKAGANKAGVEAAAKLV